MQYTVSINGHEVSKFYAGFMNYVVDGVDYYSPSKAAEACNTDIDSFLAILYSLPL